MGPAADLEVLAKGKICCASRQSSHNTSLHPDLRIVAATIPASTDFRDIPSKIAPVRNTAEAERAVHCGLGTVLEACIYNAAD
jgi:hypothetical protein